MAHVLHEHYFKVLEKDLVQAHPGCDMLVLNLDYPISFLENELKKLDTDNSEISTITKNDIVYTINKSGNKEFIFCDVSLSIEDVAYKIFQYKRYLSPKKIEMFKMCGQITFYSTLFRLMESGKMPYSCITDFADAFFQNEIKRLLYASISRYDYKIDFFYNTEKQIPSFQDLVENLRNTKGNTFTKGAESTGRQFGDRQNKTYLLRLYDKLADSKKKGKRHLFGDYFNYSSVLRLEAELHTKGNKDNDNQTYKFIDLEKMEYKAKVFLRLEKDSSLQQFFCQYRYTYTPMEKLFKKIPFLKRCITTLRTVADRGENPLLIFVKEVGWKTFKDQRRIWLDEVNGYLENPLPPNRKKYENT